MRRQVSHAAGIFCKNLRSSLMYALRQVITAMLLALACTAHANTITGRVVGVADGDTITVLDAEKKQHKIRLGGIDAPEGSQAFG